MSMLAELPRTSTRESEACCDTLSLWQQILVTLAAAVTVALLVAFLNRKCVAHSSAAQAPQRITAEDARLEADVSLSDENESLRTQLSEHAEEISRLKALQHEQQQANSPASSLPTGATEADSTVDETPLATTLIFTEEQLSATVSVPRLMGATTLQVAEQRYRANKRAARGVALRLCLIAMRHHAQRRIDERRFQGQLALHRGSVEEVQAEREAESEARWQGMLEHLAHVHEDLRASQLQAAQARQSVCF